MSAQRRRRDLAARIGGETEAMVRSGACDPRALLAAMARAVGRPLYRGEIEHAARMQIAAGEALLALAPEAPPEPQDRVPTADPGVAPELPPPSPARYGPCRCGHAHRAHASRRTLRAACARCPCQRYEPAEAP